MRKWLALLSVVTAGAGVSLAEPPLQELPPPTPIQTGSPAPVLLNLVAAAGPDRDPAFHNSPPGMFGDQPDLADCFWLRTDYLLWATKSAPFPAPLVTTGPPTAAIPGGLTQPGTQVLFGQSNVNYGASSGLRIDTGVWLDADRHWGLEADYFALERSASHFAVASDGSGSPILAQPLIDPKTGQEFTELLAAPGLIAGKTAITTDSRLQGWALSGAANTCRTSDFNCDVLAGLRVLSLSEGLQMSSALTPLADGVLTLANQPVATTSIETTLDSFRVRSAFYGAQLGGRVEWTTGRFTVTALGQLSVGDTEELVQVSGASFLLTPGAATVTVPGGVLAVASNIGRHFQNELAVVPEVSLEITYHITSCLEAHLGYSFLYWSAVARPGDQIDRTVEAGLVPTDPLFGTATGTRPAVPFRTTDYWAQGLNVGLLFRF